MMSQCEWTSTEEWYEWKMMICMPEHELAMFLIFRWSFHFFLDWGLWSSADIRVCQELFSGLLCITGALEAFVSLKYVFTFTLIRCWALWRFMIVNFVKICADCFVVQLLSIWSFLDVFRARTDLFCLSVSSKCDAFLANTIKPEQHSGMCKVMTRETPSHGMCTFSDRDRCYIFVLSQSVQPSI